MKVDVWIGRVFSIHFSLRSLCPLGLKNYKLEDEDELGVRTI